MEENENKGTTAKRGDKPTYEELEKTITNLHKEIDLSSKTIGFLNKIIIIFSSLATIIVGTIAIVGYLKIDEIKEIRASIDSYLKDNMQDYLDNSQKKVLTENLDYYIKNSEYQTDNGLRINTIKNGKALPEKQLNKLTEHFFGLLTSISKQKEDNYNEKVSRLLSIILKQENDIQVQSFLKSLVYYLVSPQSNLEDNTNNTILGSWDLLQYTIENIENTSDTFLKLLDYEYHNPNRLNSENALSDKLNKTPLHLDFDLKFKEAVFSRYDDIILKSPMKIQQFTSFRLYLEHLQENKTVREELASKFRSTQDRLHKKYCLIEDPKKCLYVRMDLEPYNLNFILNTVLTKKLDNSNMK